MALLDQAVLSAFNGNEAIGLDDIVSHCAKPDDIEQMRPAVEIIINQLVARNVVYSVSVCPGLFVLAPKHRPAATSNVQRGRIRG
ncbi:hypothetical protein CGZ80_15890 [Rhodopirellula sp. MGV]|nr:hypothetical protein CGZ80_15890 [Rhodopirellula sp. MGV]PNY33577.1 hypothetical protein C2E31_27615 [Rhodopirellula baltica]